MANWPAYSAGSARINLRPQLQNGFKAQVKELLRPINESIKVTAKPQLAANFKTDLRNLVKAGSQGVGATITVDSKLKNGFKADLRSKVRTAAEGIGVTVEVDSKLKPGFRTELRNQVREATRGINATVGLRVDSTGVRAQVRSAVSNLAAARVGLDLDFAHAVSQLEAFRAQVAAQPLALNVNVDTAAAVAQLMALRSLASTVTNQVNGINVGGGLSSAARQRLTGGIFTRPVRAIRMQIEIDRASIARAEAEVAAVAARLSQARNQQTAATDRLTLAEQRHREVMSRANASESQRIAATQALTRARNGLAESQGRVNALMDDEYNARRRVDTARDNRSGFFGLAAAGLRGLAGAVGSAASNMLNFTNIVNVALVGLVALAAVSLVPLIGQLAQAAGVVALFPAALAGAVSVFAAVKIGVSGVGDAFDAAKKAADSAGSDMEARGKAVASAQKQVASAVKGVASAERGVRTAEKASLQAQKDLNRARKEAADDIDDLNRALGRTMLTEQAAAIAVAEAQRELWNTFTDPESDAIDRARAQNSLDTAIADQQDLLRDNRKLADQAADANAKGIEGSDKVVAAHERVADAAQAEQDANQNLADANATLAEAQQAVTDAMNEGSDAAKKFDDAMAKLSPNAQDFVRKLLEVKDAYRGLKQDLQDRLFDRLGASVSDLAYAYLPTLHTGLGSITDAINVGLRNALKDLNTEATRDKLSDIFANTAAAVGPAIDGINNLVQGFLSLADAGSDFLPGISSSFEAMTGRFREWAESEEGQNSFKQFLQDSLDTFNTLKGIVGDVGGIIKNLFGGSDETGESWLKSMANTLDEWNNFLGTPEGQAKIKDFFREVKETVDAIVTAIKLANGIIDAITPDAPNADDSPDDVLDPQGSDGAGLDGWKSTPDPNAIDPSKTEGVGPLKKFYNYKGERVDEQGRVLDHTGKSPWHAAPEGSAWDRVQDFVESTSLPGSNRDDDDRKPPSTEQGAQRRRNKPGGGGHKNPIVQDLEDTSKATDKYLSDAGRSWEGFGDRVRGVVKKSRDEAFTDLASSTEGVATDADGQVAVSAGDSWAKFGVRVSETVETTTGDSVLGSLRSKFNELPGFFTGLVGGIGVEFGKLPGVLTGPVNSVIDILNMFGDIWNKVADKLGLPKWEPLGQVGAVGQLGRENPAAQPIGGRWMGGPGGPVRGPGGPKEDKAGLYRLSAGEHVWTADEVAAAGGHDAMYRMRKGVLGTGGKQSKADGPLPGYADGGIVSTSDPLDPIQVHLWDLVSSAIPGAILTSGKRFADVGSGFDYHMQGKAIDLAGPMDQIAKWIYDTYPQSTELIHWPLNGWSNLKNGAPLNYGEPTNSQHMDHVHWAANSFLTQLTDDQKNSLFDRVRAMAGSALGAGRGIALDNLVRRPLNALVDRVPDYPGLGEFGQMPKAFVRKMADAVTSFISSKLGGSGGGLVDYEATGNVERWRDLAKEAMRRTGFNADDENQVNAMLAQIKSESGGNPSILQQVLDVNSGGNEAQGLLQVIPGTFAAYRDKSLPDDRTDPLANMVAALNYYKDRYGNDLTTEWGHGHGYANGGWVNGPGGPLADKIRALLSNGEFVVRAGAAGQWGPLLEAINGGLKPQAKTLEQPFTPFDPNTPPYGGAAPPDTTLLGGTPVPGVDTVSSLKKKTHDRFKGALDTGFNDLVSSTLGPLGLPDPRTLIPSEVTDYADTFNKWSQAKAQFPATQALQQSGYYQAGQHAVGAANTVMQSTQGGNTTLRSIDQSMTVNLFPRDDADALRKFNQMADLHAIQHTGRAGGI